MFEVVCLLSSHLNIFDSLSYLQNIAAAKKSGAQLIFDFYLVNALFIFQFF